MATVYLSHQGTSVQKQGRRLVVKAGTETVQHVRMFELDQLVIIGNIHLTTPAIHLLLDEGIETIFMTVHGRYRGRLQTPESKNIRLRQKQFRRADEEGFRMAVARQIVSGKLTNLRLLLMRHRRRKGLDTLSDIIYRIRRGAERTTQATTLDELRGIEGAATRAYCHGLRELFTEDMGFEGRNRRPPLDPVNALLSFGYTLLASCIQSAVQMAGLDPYLGFFHETRYGRPSMVLDLMEEFRPIIVDSLVLYVVNRRILTPAHFEVGTGDAPPVLLNEEGRRVWIQQFQQRINTEATYERTGQMLPYRRCFELQARLMSGAIQSDRLTYVPMKMRP